MTERFLLYIDILGFSDLVIAQKEILPDLFRVLDSSNAHKHGDFGVIQFSDTLLVYNAPEAGTGRWKNYCSMYLCEFAQEIQYMLLGRDTYFRGLITYGQFEDTGPVPNAAYKNVRAFWGEALIRAYRSEKNIQAVGLFVDETVQPFMDISKTQLYDRTNKVWFVDTATMLRNKGFEGTDFSYAREEAIATGNESLLAYDLLYLKRLFDHAHDTALLPSVRAKYQTTWEIYRAKYLGLCSALEANNFEFEKVIELDWDPFMRKIGTPDGFFG